MPEEVLRQRNQKGLYESSLDELAGFGVNVEEPKSPDIVVVNDGKLTPSEIVEKIMEEFA